MDGRHVRQAGNVMAEPPTAAPDPDQAWKVLSVTNDWIRHADAKTGVTLAFVGATTGLTYSLVQGLASWSLLLVICAVVLVVALFGAAAYCWLALFPRVGSRRRAAGPTRPQSLIYFGSIASAYAEDAAIYRTALADLTANATALTEQVADQVGINANIARAKFEYSQRAIMLEFIAASLLLIFLASAPMEW